MNKTIILSCINIEPKDYELVQNIMQENWTELCRLFKAPNDIEIKLDYSDYKPSENLTQ